jgi:hypothetical protein
MLIFYNKNNFNILTLVNQKLLLIINFILYYYEKYYRNALFLKKCAKNILPKYIILYHYIINSIEMHVLRKSAQKNSYIYTDAHSALLVQIYEKIL